MMALFSVKINTDKKYEHNYTAGQIRELVNNRNVVIQECASEKWAEDWPTIGEIIDVIILESEK